MRIRRWLATTVYGNMLASIENHAIEQVNQKILSKALEEHKVKLVEMAFEEYGAFETYTDYGDENTTPEDVCFGTDWALETGLASAIARMMCKRFMIDYNKAVKEEIEIINNERTLENGKPYEKSEKDIMYYSLKEEERQRRLNGISDKSKRCEINFDLHNDSEFKDKIWEQLYGEGSDK